MTRQVYTVEKGFRGLVENTDTGFDLLVGTAVPDGTSGGQGDAGVPSLYFRVGTDEIYKKKANAGAPGDWELLNTSNQVGTFRPEKVRAVTGDTGVTPGSPRNLTTTPFSDDDGTTLVAGDFTVGEFLIANNVLLEVTDVSAPSVTFSTPSSAPALAENDTFLVPNYLPDDGDDQEGQALVQYNGSVIAKIGDINWNFADGINMASPYTAGSGDPDANDTVQTAIQKVDGNNDAQDTLIGTSQGATDLGTFSGNTIPDNSTVKSALQSQETAYEETDQNVDDLITLSGMPENSQNNGTFPGTTIPDNLTTKQVLIQLEGKDESQDTTINEIDGNVNDLISLSGVAENSTNLGAFTGFGAILLTATETVKSAIQKVTDFLGNLRSVEVTGVTTIVSVDEVPVATVGACKWFIMAFEEATPANRESIEVYALNDGVNADYNDVSKLKLGTTGGNFLSITVDVSGGNMRLRATSSTAGLTIRARRVAVEDV